MNSSLPNNLIFKVVKNRTFIDTPIIRLIDVVKSVYSDIILKNIKGSFFKIVIYDYKFLKESDLLEFSIDTISPIMLNYEGIKFVIFKDFYIDKDLSDDLNYGEICDICNGKLESEQERSEYEMTVIIPKLKNGQKQPGTTSIFYKSIE